VVGRLPPACVAACEWGEADSSPLQRCYDERQMVRLTTRLHAGARVRCGALPTPRRQLPRTGDGRGLARGVVSRALGVNDRENAARGEGEDHRPTVALGVVVEGINDVKAVHAAVRATEVHSLSGYGALQPGFRLGKHAHAELTQLKARHAQLVVLTDPDVSGRHLRETLERDLGPLLYVPAYAIHQGLSSWAYAGGRGESLCAQALRSAPDPATGVHVQARIRERGRRHRIRAQEVRRVRSKLAGRGRRRERSRGSRGSSFTHKP
jgi:5S rRNA maturation endonuclease (ribonuclease M5)